MALVGAGGSGDANVPVDVVPPDAGLAEPEFLAEGVHAGDALLQVPAGPDVAEAGHASMLRFIRTGRNRKKTPAQGAEQTGGLAGFQGMACIINTPRLVWCLSLLPAPRKGQSSALYRASTLGAVHRRTNSATNQAGSPD